MSELSPDRIDRFHPSRFALVLIGLLNLLVLGIPYAMTLIAFRSDGFSGMLMLGILLYIAVPIVLFVSGVALIGAIVPWSAMWQGQDFEETAK